MDKAKQRLPPRDLARERTLAKHGILCLFQQSRKREPNATSKARLPPLPLQQQETEACRSGGMATGQEEGFVSCFEGLLSTGGMATGQEEGFVSCFEGLLSIVFG